MLRPIAIAGIIACSSLASRADLPQRPASVCRVEPFPLTQVRLLDGPFREAMLRNQAYLLSLDANRLLHAFRLTAGLPSTAQPYGGWEEPKSEVRGHTMGHYLSACALTYASTGDERFKSRADVIVAELAKCQEALPGQGYHAGYLAAFPESFIDRVEARQPVWVPWYTLHKIMAGLLEVHQYCRNEQALTIVERLAGWIRFRVDRLTPEQMQASLDTEFGGMNEVLANLYAISRDPEHLRLAQAFDHRRVFDPLAQGVDALNGLHANTQIPKMIGAAREYEVTGQERYRDIAEFFWDRVALHRSYVIGGHSDGEHFFPVDQFRDHLTTQTTETCNTYNMLKLTRHLFAWDPSARVMDFYERGLFNHILASQDPQKGMFVYLMSLNPGHFKTYSTPEDSFWCCVGTGMENHAKYADTIYFHDSKSLYINLFIASELNWAEKGLIVRQETAFPESDTTLLTVECSKPVDLDVKVRCPSWAMSGVALTLNGKSLEVRGEPGSYVAVQRTWQEGDRLEVRLPMSLRIEPLPYTTDTVAILYGPIVLAGQLGTDAMPSPYARSQVDQVGLPVPQVPVFVATDGDLLRHIKRADGPGLTFRTDGLGQPSDVTLIPFYRTHHQRYSVYWKVYAPQAWERQKAALTAEEARQRALTARSIDIVQPGDPQSETHHNLQGRNMRTGAFLDHRWRDALNDAFSWDLKVDPATPMVVRCTYWGSDEGRTFDIWVDDHKIATQTLNKNKPGELFDVEYPIRPDLTRDKTKVTVRFQSAPNNIAGGVFGCGIYRPAN